MHETASDETVMLTTNEPTVWLLAAGVVTFTVGALESFTAKTTLKCGTNIFVFPPFVFAEKYPEIFGIILDEHVYDE